MGLVTAMTNYIRGGCIDYSAAVSGSIFAFIGSIIGTRLAISLSPKILQITLMVILPLVGVFIFTRGSEKSHPDKPPLAYKRKLIFCSLIGFIFGGYDGFFGPGAGMFMTIALAGLVRLDLVKSAGTAKVINFSSNFTSMITWMINGKILFPVAIPCMICAIAGGYLGSRMAMKVGKKFIRLILVLVAVLLFIKIV